MSDEQPRLGRHHEWLIEVAAQAKMRPWWQPPMCRYCFHTQDIDEKRGEAHAEDCAFAALDAALDKEPT